MKEEQERGKPGSLKALKEKHPLLHSLILGILAVLTLCGHLILNLKNTSLALNLILNLPRKIL